jgi:hypothetical protein
MGLGADVLVVAGQQDQVANRLRRDLEKAGRRVALLDGRTAARLFTIRVRPDGPIVTPTLPIFVRASAWWYDPHSADADEQFLRAEAHATFWAATALSRTPVINRIGSGSAVGRLTAAALAEPPVPETAIEIHASSPGFIESGTDDTIWGEDGEFRVGALAELRPDEPLRARRVNLTALYEIVTIVGDRAFSATTDPRSVELDLAQRSLVLCRRFELHFATVTWAVDEQGATPVRLNPAPEEGELRYIWPDVSAALRADLTI